MAYREVIDNFLNSIDKQDMDISCKVANLTGFIKGAYDFISNEDIGYDYTYEQVLDGYLYGMYKLLGGKR